MPKIPLTSPKTILIHRLLHQYHTSPNLIDTLATGLTSWFSNLIFDLEFMILIVFLADSLIVIKGFFAGGGDVRVWDLGNI